MTKFIVVVENDSSMSQAIDRILRLGGFATATFESAEAALAADAATADCLVLDIHLPGMSGLEMYKRLTPNGGGPPAIFITAHDEQAFREEAKRMGAKGYLPKPFMGRTLLDVINRALDPNCFTQ